MIHVKQRERYSDKDKRGDCWTACVASIFEVPYESLPDLNANRQSSLLMEWLGQHYPGVGLRTQDFVPFDVAEDGDQLSRLAKHGFWIASVESPRFEEPCTIHTAEGGTEMPPFWYDAPGCPHCHGTGTRQGFHAVVCRNQEVVHDPHPDVTGYGWEYNGRLCGASWFVVEDPSRLIPRRLP